MGFQRAILTHGGADSDSKNTDGTKTAANIGMDLMIKNRSSLTAAVNAVAFLEDDPRFNAGIGSQPRADEETIQLDAACMTSKEQFGAVACVEGVQNPIKLAERILLDSPHILLTGQGAHHFAKEHNIFIKPLSSLNVGTPLKKNPTCDTVGAITFDGETFAAALSSGGLAKASIGRVGDVPLPGCGLFCGKIGAVACTGDGESIALKVLAKEVYGWLEQGMKPDDAAKKALTLFDTTIDIGLILLTKNEFAANSRTDMAWSHLVEAKL